MKHKGNLFITNENKNSFGNLTSITGSLYIEADNASLPALTSITGSLYIEADFNFNLGNHLKNKTYKAIDGKLFIIKSEKKTKGIKLYTGYNFLKIENEKIIKEECFVAEKGTFFAHGLTIKKAIQDVLFKIVVEKLKHDPIKKDTKITVKYYIAITGACDIGCRSFMKQHNIPYTINYEGTNHEETIEKTFIKAVDLLPVLEKNNAYGIEKLKSLITW